MSSPTSPSCRPICWTRFHARGCARRSGTRTRWETAPFASSRTSRTGAGCSRRIRPFRRRLAALPSWRASSWSSWTSPPPSSARRLLGGRTIAFELLTVGSGEAPLEQMIQARLAGVGVRASIRQLELSAFLDRVNPRRHDFDAAVVGTAGDPGLGYLSQLADLAGLRAPADPATAQRLFRDSLPIAFLYHARGVQGMNRRVQGVRMDVRGELPAVTQWRIGP